MQQFRSSCWLPQKPVCLYTHRGVFWVLPAISITEGGNSPLTMNVVYGLLVVGGACFVAVLGLALVQRLVPTTIRKEYNDVAGFIYAVLGVIYAVLLALVVIATWEEFGRASVTVETGANAFHGAFSREFTCVGPHRRHPGKPPRGRASHGGWTGALRRRARPGPAAGGRQEDALGRGRGEPTNRPVGGSDCWGDCGGGLRLPLRLGEHKGARTDGRIASGGDRAGFVHHSRHGQSLLRRCPSWPRGLRAGAEEVRDEQAQRPLRISACATWAAKHHEDRCCLELVPSSCPFSRASWKINSAKFAVTLVFPVCRV